MKLLGACEVLVILDCNLHYRLNQFQFTVNSNYIYKYASMVILCGDVIIVVIINSSNCRKDLAFNFFAFFPL